MSGHQVNPVAAAERYMQLTEDLPNSANEENLFIGSIRLQKPVVGSTIAEVRPPREQQPRGYPIQAILKTANWSSESTFAKFYRRDLHKDPHRQR
ncbi:hypothetical protein OUZ56_009775 [Daphnia magna]|uniref:Uncharacterized protein n=1 Tax=Daphnia magna TaxID=35525 RepID=A0ABR0AH01_9CRUS|nr:hypothetical protein OUZ56_009775 [Daphnia magna]